MEQPAVDDQRPATDAEPRREAKAAKPDGPPPPGGIALWRASLAVVLVGVAADQAVKAWAKAVLEPMLHEPGRQAIGVVPGLFELRYGENTGAAFSILEGRTGLLAVISALAVVGLAWWWTRMGAREAWGRIGAAMVLSGAMGNLIDRAARGYVVDMFHAYWRSYSWPIFNVADSLICVGMAILVWRVWKGAV